MNDEFSKDYPFSNYWIFQFNPEIYDWLGWIKEHKANEQWLVSRFAKFICIGDKVVIWASGKEGGIYAFGEVVTYPQKKGLNPEQAIHYKIISDLDKFRKKPSVFIKYLKVFVDRPISKDVCKKNKVLSTLVLNDFANATNFKLSKTQWLRILELIQ